MISSEGVTVFKQIFIGALIMSLQASTSAFSYELTADSMPQDGVPKGTVTKHQWEFSKVFLGTLRDYWIYVPAQYDENKPACVAVFQDGLAYVSDTGQARVPVVFDNLIHKKEMPVTIGIFINPGKKSGLIGSNQRSIEYDTLSDAYSRFLLDEILPEVGKTYNLTDDPDGRLIGGISSGGICAFTVAWERPDAFRKVISHVGSFADIRGGHDYPSMIRKTRGNPKPIRVFLQAGEKDLNVTPGNWTLSNLQMESALKFARYDYRFEMGTGGHSLEHGGAILPDTLRWIWRDYPGVKKADLGIPNIDDVTGTWEMTTNIMGKDGTSVMTVTAENGKLAVYLKNKNGGEPKATNVTLKEDILSFDYAAPAGEGQRMAVWLKFSDGRLEGALGSMEPTDDVMIDYPMTGKKIR
jgi:enterochelin esterase family protein